jgi:transglutaminase-like putative cysteine protease
MSTATAPRAPSNPLLAAARPDAWTLRLVSFCALGVFGAVHWAGIVRPGAGGDLLGLFLVALVAGIVTSAALTLEGRAARWAAVGATLLVALLLMLLVAGMPAWYLRPDRWDTLVVDVANGIGTLPALRMPYRGTDQWVRTVLIAGGGVLLTSAAILALMPRPWMFGAAFTLTILYVTAIVEHRPAHPYLDGAVFALLLAGFLWGDRLTGKEAPLAASLAVGAVLASALLAPHIDSRTPWVDYEALAEALQGGKTTTFAWNHSYAPLSWPRDGLELARVRSRGDLYMKTANLEDFDGREWVQAKGVLDAGDDTQFSLRHQDWSQTIHVSIKGLRSRQFLTAGTATFINHSSKDVDGATPGTFKATGKPLRRGDGYDATVYYPDPSTAEMRLAGTRYPYFAVSKLGVRLPDQPGIGPLQIRFAPWGSGVASTAQGVYGFQQLDPDLALQSSPYAREYALAKLIKGASTDPYDYVRQVIARVQRGARYTESPPSPGRLPPLDAFLFRDHAGYCQHFAGATALLLRMGGVPARVVAGFSPGSRDSGDHILRDFDAHSWVEVYFPRIGWVTFDPTPADSPARSQQTDTLSVKAAAPTAQGRQAPAGDRTSDPSSGGSAASDAASSTDPVPLIAGGVALVALVGGGVLLVWRRRRMLARSGDPEVEELRLALARSGRPPDSDLTLARIEQRFAGNDGAGGYVRALRVARYGAGAAPPTPAQRRALRHELGAGLGLRGRLRSLWALPPRSAELRDALRPRRRRSYNQRP